MPDSEKQESAYGRFSWRYAAILSSLVSVAALTTVLILVATTDADALSSVALILAVLAFIIQIIVFIVDFSLNVQRDKEARELNNATLSLLRQIETKTDSTNDIVQQQMQRVFEKFVLDVKADGGVQDQSTLLETLRENFEEQLASSRSQGAPTSNSQADGARPVSPARRRRAETWPSLGTVVTLKRHGIEELDNAALAAIRSLGNDVLLSADAGVIEGISLHEFAEPTIEGLRERGFIRGDRGLGIWVLTAKGFDLARLLIAPDPIPDSISEALPWLQTARQA